jgi:hypothetical protein
VTRDEAFERVKKLMERARTDVGPEARAARRLARELMEKYGITYTERVPKVRTSAQKSAVAHGPRRASTPATITLKVGNVRIRWKL